MARPLSNSATLHQSEGSRSPLPFGAGARPSRATRLSAMLAGSLLLAVGCGGARGAATPAQPPPPSAGAGSASPRAYSTKIPLEADDPFWGDATAPVTLVAFVDFECPFCARAHATLAALQERYGPEKLRVVTKHLPLPFHRSALISAAAAQAVWQLAGQRAFVSYTAKLYASQRDLSEANLIEWAQEIGVSHDAFLRAYESPEVRRAVLEDVSLAEQLGIEGTPTFRINGLALEGAVPEEQFAQLIDRELVAAEQLLAQGMPSEELYASRVKSNFVPPPKRGPASDAPPVDETVYAIPLGEAAWRGSADAPVTIVQFSEFQCPFCARVEPTLDALLERYPGKLKIVFRHNPLPFHEQALPAATFAEEARRQQGDDGFWRAAHGLFEHQKQLGSATYAALSEQLGLDASQVERALRDAPYKRRIEADQVVAEDFGAAGTPHFFVNGRRLSGAQPIEVFSELVDEQLAKAEQLMLARHLTAGQVYDEILATGQGPAEPEVLDVGPIPTEAPSRGPADAPIVLQVFSDFECPFCARLAPVLDELSGQYPEQLRIVWRNLPLPFHAHARAAAAAALEAKAQQGDAGFWKMHDAIFGHSDEQILEREQLESFAKEIGLDMTRFARALDDSTHEAAISRDVDAALSAGLRGTPSSLVNGIPVRGAQPVAAFERAIRQALARATPAASQ